MAQEEALRCVGSLVADSGLAVFTGAPGTPGAASPNTGNQYRFCKVNGVNQLTRAAAATDIHAGIMQNKPQAAGDPVQLGIDGISLIMTGGAISAGNKLASDSVGRGVHDDTNGHWQALETAAGAGALIRCMKL